MNGMTPIEQYGKQLEKHTVHLGRLKKKETLLGWLRLGIVVATALVAYQLFQQTGAEGWIAIGAGLIFFLILLSIDSDNNTAIANTNRLITINQEEQKIVNHQYKHRFDGTPYAPAVHYFAEDLDIFGTSSLYQYINRCSTEQGRGLLANDLLTLLPTAAIKERHEAIQELSVLLEWRQQLQSHALQSPVTATLENKIENWLKNDRSFFTHSLWAIVVPAYTVITVASALAAVLGYIPPNVFSLLFLVYFFFTSALSKKVMKTYIHLSGIVTEVDTISQLISWIEKQTFTASLLNRLKQAMRPASGTAGGQIKRLKEILNRFDLRLNVFLFIFLNSFLLWDVRQTRALNKWKKENKELVPHWFATIAEVEVVTTLAILHFNQPAWCFAAFSANYFELKGNEIGHPLLAAEQRVVSDFVLEGTGKIALITGSNMAGKSTFLRSLGVNTVLAQIGAPVCAKQFTLSPMKLMTSMRIADNLAENTSTFYAELKKLQTIIEAVKKHQPLFILLDEILRGTNSLDRHTGSKALIRQLIKENAVAIIATHDVALTNLTEEFTAAIDNYHFDVQVSNDELYFDYKLKEGVCQSLNASILMRKIGIELD